MSRDNHYVADQPDGTNCAPEEDNMDTTDQTHGIYRVAVKLFHANN